MRRPFFTIAAQLLDRAYVCRLGAFLPLRHVELDTLPFGERAEALSLNGGVVDEDVVSILARDEAEALLVAEPLDGSLQLGVPPFRCRSRGGVVALLCRGA